MDQPVTFTNSRGLTLAGTLVCPQEKGPHRVIVFSQGPEMGMATRFNRTVADEMCLNGVASLLFDFTGHGESEGTVEQGTRRQQLDDLASAITFLEREPAVDISRVCVAGSGWGADTAANLSTQDTRITTLILENARLDVSTLQVGHLITVPTLIVVGAFQPDCLVESRLLYAAIPDNKRLEVIPGVADPVADSRAATEQLISTIRQWMALNFNGPRISEGDQEAAWP